MNADPFSITSKNSTRPPRGTRGSIWDPICFHSPTDPRALHIYSILPHAGVDPRRPTPKQSTLPPRGRVDLYRIIYGSNPRPIRFGSVLALSPTTCGPSAYHAATLPLNHPLLKTSVRKASHYNADSSISQ
uniref:Uncharacterized protein n=1 Tax=Caenorhabditis japonica TaxID=281687 RepID=A0A8R1EGW2_CAEJA